MPLHAIIGTDDGKVSEEASKLFQKLKVVEADDFNNEIIDGNSSNAETAFQICQQTIQALQTIGLFGGAKAVWLKNANFLADDRTGSSARTKDGVLALQEALEEGLPEEVTFILSATAIDKRRTFFKFLKKSASLKTYDVIDISRDGWEDKVAKIVVTEAKNHDLTLTSEALDLFVQRCAENTRQIKSEVQKIDLFLGPAQRVISLQEVENLVPTSRKGVIWEISRSIETRRPKTALKLIDAQLNAGVTAIAILRAAILPTVRNLFYGSVVHTIPGLSTTSYSSFQKALADLPSELAAIFPTKKDGSVNAYPLFNAAQKSQKFDKSGLQSALKFCLEADRSLVTSSLDPRLILHRLVIRLNFDAKSPV